MHAPTDADLGGGPGSACCRSAASLALGRRRGWSREKCRPDKGRRQLQPSPPAGVGPDPVPLSKAPRAGGAELVPGRLLGLSRTLARQQGSPPAEPKESHYMPDQRFHLMTRE